MQPSPTLNLTKISPELFFKNKILFILCVWAFCLNVYLFTTCLPGARETKIIEVCELLT